MEYKIGKEARCAVIGYGSWATAIVGLLAANEARVGWYVRNPEVLEGLLGEGRNPRYLSDVEFDRRRIAPSDDLDEVVREADIVILATPSAYLKTFLEPLTVSLQDKFVVSAIKGIVPGDYKTIVEYVHDRYDLSYKQIGIITGPSHAEEVSRGKLSYLTVVCTDPENAQMLGEKFATDYIHLSYSTDLYGIEYAAILKNIYALSVADRQQRRRDAPFSGRELPGRARHAGVGLSGRPAGDLLLGLQPQPAAGTAHRPRLHGQKRPQRNDDGRRRLLRRRLHPSHQRPPQDRNADRRNGLQRALPRGFGAQVHERTDIQINLTITWKL